MDDRYWNRTGTAQAHYDEMDAAGFKFTKATEAVFHSYYRYYNDGDLPGWARSRWTSPGTASPTATVCSPMRARRSSSAGSPSGFKSSTPASSRHSTAPPERGRRATVFKSTGHTAQKGTHHA